MELTVVVPAYNEERRLRPTLDAICAHLRADPERWGDWELIVVDDGSTDGTAAIAARAAADEPRIHVLTSDENRGKGYALRQGVLASYGRRVLVTDADLATPIEELDTLDALLAPDGGAPGDEFSRGTDDESSHGTYDDAPGAAPAPAAAPAAAIGSRALPGSRIDVRQRPCANGSAASATASSGSSPYAAYATPSAASSSSTATRRAPPSPPPASTAGA